MQSSYQKILILILGLNGALLLGSCSKKYTTDHPLNMLRVDIGNEPSSLDPLIAEDASSYRVVEDLFAGLVDFDQHKHVIPGLAEKWDISPDHKTYTFHLRKNIKFSDGKPITASDFVYSWRRLADPKTGSRCGYLLASIVNARAIMHSKQTPDTLGVSAPDSNTFIVKLTAPDADFLKKNTTNLAVVPKQTIIKYGNNWTDPRHIVTSGAYKLTAHVVNGYLLATRNPYFYDAKNVSIKQVKYYPYMHTDTSMYSYAAGDLDTTFQSISVDQYANIKAKYKQQLHKVKQEYLGFYDFNMHYPILANNLPLRQALSMAIDREVLAKEVLNGVADPVYAMVTPTVDGGAYASVHYAWSSWPRSKRLAEARRLYRLAGYGPRHPLNITVTYDTNDMYKKITLAMATMWKSNLGVKVNIVNQEFRVFLQNEHNGAYQIARSWWDADYDGVSNYMKLYTCDSPQNDTKWCNPTFDALVRQANIEIEPAKRKSLYKEALQIVQDSYSTIPLFQLSYTRLIKPYVLNYNIDDNHLDFVETKWMKLIK